VNTTDAKPSRLTMSVVIPTLKRAESLRVTLDSLAADAQTSDLSSVQVVVVCDGEDEGTRALAESYTAAGIDIEWLFHAENLGLPSARNSGAAKANGDLVLFLDDDVEAAPGLLREHIAAHAAAEQQEPGFMYAACGRIVEAPHAKQSSRTGEFLEQSWMQTLAQYEQGLRTGETDPNLADALELSCFGLNCSMRRELFARTDGFNPLLRRMDEELEYGVRLYMQGVRFLSTPATVLHRNTKDMVVYFSGCWVLGGSCDTLRAVRLGQRNAQIRSLLKLDTGPALEQWTNRAFWHAHRDMQPVSDGLRWVTERTGSRLAFRLWHDVERLSRYWAGVQDTGMEREDLRNVAGEPIRVVMLHSIAEPRSEGEASYYLSPERFRRLLEDMQSGGYVCADPRKVEYADAKWSARELVLTFDDGYEDFYTAVFPRVAEYGLKPLVFLVADRIGDSNRWDQEAGLRRRKLLNFDQIRELQRYGVRFGSHTLTHRSLPALNGTDLRREIAESKLRLEELLGQEVSAIAYPYGHTNRRVRAAVIESGYKAAFTTAEGLNVWQDPFALRRIDINERVKPWTYRWRLRAGIAPRASIKRELLPLLQMIPHEVRRPLENAWRGRRG
jgi:peptidoglycan/xylan/chitin deacetylase (PgdA/CDA1 family)/GT2 family glycosyltransferase